MVEWSGVNRVVTSLPRLKFNLGKTAGCCMEDVVITGTRQVMDCLCPNPLSYNTISINAIHLWKVLTTLLTFLKFVWWHEVLDDIFSLFSLSLLLQYYVFNERLSLYLAELLLYYFSVVVLRIICYSLNRRLSKFRHNFQRMKKKEKRMSTNPNLAHCKI